MMLDRSAIKLREQETALLDSVLEVLFRSPGGIWDKLSQRLFSQCFDKRI